jgi:hypothetical protein
MYALMHLQAVSIAEHFTTHTTAVSALRSIYGVLFVESTLMTKQKQRLFPKFQILTD